MDENGIKFDNSRSVEQTIIDPAYKLYGGELSKRHPVNIQSDGDIITVVKMDDDGKPYNVEFINSQIVTDQESLSTVGSDIATKHWSSIQLTFDILKYIGELKGL